MNNIFSHQILNWYAQHRRELPWRGEKITPYEVVVSEFMLQQTQVPKVKEKFKQFIAQFPTIDDLAAARTAEVIAAWSGLGYNRRALLLHRFAKEVCAVYHGTIPTNNEKLQQLPGMGSYTTGAVLSFAYNLPEPAIDVNVRRIYLRFFQGRDQGLPMGKKEEQELYHFVKQTIPENKSTDFHSALMDFGSLVCTRKAPQCSSCLLQASCQFFPLYNSNPRKAFFAAEKRKELGVVENGKHIPNRIFRGRIVEFVRQNQGKEISIPDLGKIIKKDYHLKEEQWLLSLVEKLQQEGLLNFSIVKKKITLALPSS